jgi:hypothetical protein
MVNELQELIMRRVIREFVQGSRLVELMVDARNINWVQSENSTMADKILTEAQKVEAKINNSVNSELVKSAISVFREQLSESLINSLVHTSRLNADSLKPLLAILPTLRAYVEAQDMPLKDLLPFLKQQLETRLSIS